jgi:hypothetical protein
MNLAKAVNLLGFQIGWFATVLGAANGYPWLGVIAVALLLALHLVMSGATWPGELRLALTASAIGFVVETALVNAGAFAPIPWLLPSPPFAPPWMAMLWINQALTLNASLAWMRGRYWLGAALGAIGGQMAYLGGAKLGATVSLPSQSGLIILGITWAIAFPALQWLATREHKTSDNL